MKKIVISNDLLSRLPLFSIGVLEFRANVLNHDSINPLIHQLEMDIKNHYTLSEVLEIPNIKSAREAYKTLGKDPSRYRLAVESLYRRIVKDNPLYRINNVVDLGNVLSLKTAKSTAVFDLNQIIGDVTIRMGGSEVYEGIGRGIINIENIPIYCDDLGPFGSTTSDTMRTMITHETKNVLVFIISFSGATDLQRDINLCMELYRNYAEGHDFRYTII